MTHARGGRIPQHPRSLTPVTIDEGSPQGDRAISDDVVTVVRAVASRGRALVGTGAQALGSGVEEALRVLVGRRMERALRPGAPTITTDELLDALDTRSRSGMSPWIGAGAARLARTGRAAKVLGGRTPVGLAVRFGPALYAVISDNLRALDAAAGHLVTRARGRGVEPEPERLRRVVVQALTGEPIDPVADVDHGALMRVWLGDAGRRAVPFGLDRISGLRAGRTPEAVAAVLGAVDVDRLAGR